MQTAFRQMHSLTYANATVYQLSLRYSTMIVPLNARMAMLNATQDDDETAEVTCMEDNEELDDL